MFHCHLSFQGVPRKQRKILFCKAVAGCMVNLDRKYQPPFGLQLFSCLVDAFFKSNKWISSDPRMAYLPSFSWCLWLVNIPVPWILWEYLRKSCPDETLYAGGTPLLLVDPKDGSNCFFSANPMLPGGVWLGGTCRNGRNTFTYQSCRIKRSLLIEVIAPFMTGRGPPCICLFCDTLGHAKAR